jgi:lambda family phage tail tape measure protein
MANQQEQISLIISAVNKTQAELNRIVADLNRVGQGAGKMGSAMSGAMGQAEAAAQGFASRLGPVGSLLTGLGPEGLAAGAGLGAVAAAIWKGTEAAAEWQRRMLRTEALLKATGHAAGLTGSELEDLAKGLDDATLLDKGEVLDAINILQTFKSVQGETFKEAIVLAGDMSSVFGHGLTSSATQLGKALEDPVEGLTALRRVGVSFTESEKDMIKAMVEAGDMAGAQAKILEVLRLQFGGAAKGEAGGLIGQVDDLGDELGKLLKTFAQTETATAAVSALAAAVRGLRQAIVEAKKTSFEDFGFTGELDAGGAGYWLGDVAPEVPMPEGQGRVAHQIQEAEKARAEAGAAAAREDQARDAETTRAKAAAEKWDKDNPAHWLKPEDLLSRAAKSQGAAAADRAGTGKNDGGLKELARLNEQDAAAVEKRDEEYQKLRETMRGLATDDLTFASQQATELGKALEESARTAERAWSTGARNALAEYADEATNAARNVGDVIGSAMREAEDVTAGAITKMKLDWNSLSNAVDSVARDIATALVRQNITGPAASALSSMFFGGASAGGSTFGADFAAYMADVFHEGGVVGQTAAPVRVVAPDVFAGAPRLHSGTGDEYRAILRRGEGVFTPEQMASLGPAGGATQIIFNVHNNTPAQVSYAKSYDSQGRLNLDLLIEQQMATAAARPGGRVQQAMNANAAVRRG